MVECQNIAFLPADAPTMLRRAMHDPHLVLSYSYLVFEPTYLVELALSNGIGRPQNGAKLRFFFMVLRPEGAG